MFRPSIVVVEDEDILFESKVSTGRKVYIPKSKLEDSNMGSGDLVNVYVRPVLREGELVKRFNKFAFLDFSEGFVRATNIGAQRKVTLPKTELRVADIEVGDRAKVLIKDIEDG